MEIDSLIGVDSNFWVINAEGKKILRNFIQENSQGFGYQAYLDGKFDDLNYMFFENFHFYDEYDCTGSDYERMGCKIQPGDVVVDIGANVGMFTRWADFRGASRIISFEPFSLTYSCLVDNSYGKAECHRLAVGSDGVIDIIVTKKISNLGGATTLSDSIEGQTVSAIEKCPSMSMDSLFSFEIIPERIDFLKIDCEGGEKKILESMTDDHILRIQKISLEYHEGILGPELRESFIQRIQSLGYSHFTLFHSGGDLVQLHFWKNNP